MPDWSILTLTVTQHVASLMIKKEIKTIDRVEDLYKYTNVVPRYNTNILSIAASTTNLYLNLYLKYDRTCECVYDDIILLQVLITSVFCLQDRKCLRLPRHDLQMCPDPFRISCCLQAENKEGDNWKCDKKRCW